MWSRGVVVAALVVASCKKELPTYTPALMPPSAAPLVIGSSTEADVMARIAALPKEELEIAKDLSLGGDMKVAFNDHPSIHIEHPKFGAAWLWNIGGSLKLGKLTLTNSEGCAWTLEHVATLDGAKNCPGNRKTGGTADGGYWCAELDGTTVHIECGRTMNDYWLGS